MVGPPRGQSMSVQPDYELPRIRIKYDQSSICMSCIWLSLTIYLSYYRKRHLCKQDTEFFIVCGIFIVLQAAPAFLLLWWRWLPQHQSSHWTCLYLSHHWTSLYCPPRGMVTAKRAALWRTSNYHFLTKVTNPWILLHANTLNYSCLFVFLLLIRSCVSILEYFFHTFLES